MLLKNMIYKNFIMNFKSVLNNKKIDSKNEFIEISINSLHIIYNGTW